MKANSTLLKEKDGEDKLNSTRERAFSLELESSNSLRHASLGEENRGRNENPSVLIEGTIGTLSKVSFVDGMILEVQGTKGTLRIDLTNQELIRSLSFSSQHEQQLQRSDVEN